MALRIRGQETTLQAIVDGALQQGSFTKVESWKITPRAELTEADFVGETESEPDLIHHGYDFSFVTHEMENGPMTIWKRMVSANQGGAPLPSVQINVIKKYRDPSIPSVTQSLSGSLRLKLDSQEAGDRKGYVKNTWSGKCRFLK